MMMKYQSLFIRHGKLTEVAVAKSGTRLVNKTFSSLVNNLGRPIHASMKELNQLSQRLKTIYMQ